VEALLKQSITATEGARLEPRSKYYPIRRSTRLALEIPVIVASLNPTDDFSENCTTVVVNAHGCGVTASKELRLGTRVQITLPAEARTTTARVVHVVRLSEHHQGSWLFGMEMEEPGNFWGIPHAPSDWKTTVNPSAATESRATRTTATEAVSSQCQTSTHVVQCQLLATSVGACYLRSSTTFPPGMPVLVRIAGKTSVHTLRGVVRVEHPEFGLGIEYLGCDGRHENGMVRLISDLGSVEGGLPQVNVERDESTPNPLTRHSHPVPSAQALHDSLLSLVLVGRTLTKEDFLRELERQRRSRSSNSQDET
jgi:hypothetical protein